MKKKLNEIKKLASSDVQLNLFSFNFKISAYYTFSH